MIKVTKHQDEEGFIYPYQDVDQSEGYTRKSFKARVEALQHQLANLPPEPEPTFSIEGLSEENLTHILEALKDCSGGAYERRYRISRSVSPFGGLYNAITASWEKHV